MPKMNHFSALHELTCMIFYTPFSNISFTYLLHFCFCKQKKFTSFKECDQYLRKISHFQGFSSALKQTCQIPALFKEIKDLYELCMKYELGKCNLF